MNKTDESTEKKTTSTNDVNIVSTQADLVEQDQEQTGRGCMHDETGFGCIRTPRYYRRDDSVIAASLVCMICGHESYLYGEQDLRDWTENAD